MSTDFNSEVSTELTSETKLTLASGKVANFCYDSEAYDNDTVAGVEEYDYDEHQNIPLGDATTLNTDSNILNKGVRSQASSLTRMMLNHFFGRTSYNVNKISDHLKNFLTLFKTFIKEGDNEWSPTVLYEAGDVVYFMTTLNYEPCKRTFVCILDCPSANLPPVYTDGSLINTTYWKEISGKIASLTVGTTNSGSTNVATFNGSITVAGNITQSGTPYETHAEQIYTKKDNIITREDATGALPSGQYSGIKVNNYDGNGANGILAYRSDGTAVVGDESGDPAVENLQPLMTRAESSQIANGAPLVWDAQNQRAIGGSTSGVSVIPTATTTVNNIPLSNNDSIRVMFTADISDTNATGGVTPLVITYNSVSIPVKANKDGALVDILAKEVQANTWKYLQAYTTLELIYQSDYDGQGNPAFIISGNPILLSSSDYVIYADGYNSMLGNIFSLSEIKTNMKWIDGRPIYKKTVDTGPLPSSASDKQINHNISNLDFVIHIEGFALNPLTKANLPLPSVSNNKTYDLGLWNDDTIIDISVGTNRSAYSITYVTLFYVKTTD